MKKTIIIVMLAVMLVPGFALAQNSIWDDIRAQLFQILEQLEVLIAERDAALVENTETETEIEVVTPLVPNLSADLNFDFNLASGDVIEVDGGPDGLFISEMTLTKCHSFPCLSEIMVMIQGDGVSPFEMSLNLDQKVAVPNFDDLYVELKRWDTLGNIAKIRFTAS